MLPLHKILTGWPLNRRARRRAAAERAWIIANPPLVDWSTFIEQEDRERRFYEAGLVSADFIRARYPDALPHIGNYLVKQVAPAPKTPEEIRAIRFEQACIAAAQMRVRTMLRRNPDLLWDTADVFHDQNGAITICWAPT